MPVELYSFPMKLAGQFQLRVKHFARGTYTEFSGQLASLPYNRFFIPLKCKKDNSCRIQDNESDFLITPGRAYFIPLNRKARLFLDEYLEFISIQFSMELYGGIDLFSRYHSIREVDSKIWKMRAINAYTEKNPYFSAVKLHALVFDFAALLTETFSQEEWDSVVRFAEFQEELDYIQSNHSSLASISVCDLARVRGFDRSSFSRNFSRITGMTPKNFLSGVLIKQACRLLLQKRCTIKEVADQLGFNNEFYFSRFFKKFMHVSPGQYREEVHKNI